MEYEHESRRDAGGTQKISMGNKLPILQFDNEELVMSYEKVIHFGGNIEKALEVARGTLLPHGFTVIENTERSVELAGPGSFLVKGQDPLVGVSRISISETNNELSIKAEFGGIHKTVKYMIIFIIGMAAFFLVLFGMILNKEGASTHKLLLPLTPFIPWPVIIPLMAMWMRSRSSRALDALLSNMATLSQEA